jgi:voltage-gated potassium channel
MAEPREDVDLVELPTAPRAPLDAIGRRVGFAIGLLVFIAVVVFLGRDGYQDSAGGDISVLDSLYYASVTVTTTGYGDISAVTNSTRLAALLLITPARILFLILVVGTTVEVLTDRSRRLLLTQRWRRRVRDHHIICGFGSTGQSAADALTNQGVSPDRIVVVDTDETAIAAANELGFTAVRGDAARVAVLHQAAIAEASSVIVTPHRDDTAVLMTLTARELNPDIHIVATARVRENLHLLEQSGADAVIDSSAAVGRLVGLATRTPNALQLIDDLIDAGSDLELTEVAPVDRNGSLSIPDGVALVEVIRDAERIPFDDPRIATLTPSDRLVVVRSAH